MSISIQKFNDANQFADKAMPYLMTDEGTNSLMISILMKVMANPGYYGDACQVYMATIERRDSMIGAFLRTAPHNLIVSSSCNQALKMIAEDQKEVSLPGVIGPKDSAHQYARHHCAMSGQKYRVRTAERLFKLEKVISPQPTAGNIRIANDDDLPLVREWMASFIDDCHLDPKLNDPATMAKRNIVKQTLYLWTDGEIASMAGVNRETPNGANIGFVYTPSRLRCRGYASAIVAAISQKMLTTGKQFCFLFTDIANPTSNKIYQAIGYQAITDFDEIEFVE